MNDIDKDNLNNQNKVDFLETMLRTEIMHFVSADLLVIMI